MGVAVGGPTPGAAVGADDDTDTDTDRSTRTHARARWQLWRSPPDQPPWARPALLLVAALAALSYCWGMAHASLETFYGGAVRSMSQSWHDFFFGSFDPWGTVSVDKLPGAFWLQALSLRVFGVHMWAYVLPSAIEGTLTVLVLYRVVRRVAGAGAGLTAAVALAATPVTILLNRGNISDSLLVLLLVLAADAATSAYLTGRVGALVLAGLWVGLAFQAKMVQAWIVLPALYLAYLLAAPAADLVRRFGHVALSLLVAVAVSLSWMCIVTLVPAHDRPYVDGSCDNSVFSQVFLYNGADRLTGNTLDQPGCTEPPVAVTSTSTGGAKTVSLGTGPGRFLNGLLGRDAAWLFFPALVALVGIVLSRRNEPRRDPWRAAAVLWGVWLFFTWAFFASSQFLNSYYLAALAPAMAALCGLGLALAWRRREESPVVPVVLMATVAAGVAYAVYLVPDSAGVRPWIIATSALATAAALVVLARSLRPGRRAWERRYGLVLGAGALLLGAVWASATSVAAELGPFDSPYQPAAVTAAEQANWQHYLATWPALVAFTRTSPPTQAADTWETSAQVSTFVLATGSEFLPVGGFSGQVPSTPLPVFIADVRDGRISRVAVSVRPRTRNPDMVWTEAHCAVVRTPDGTLHFNGNLYRRYVCTPPDAGGPG